MFGLVYYIFSCILLLGVDEVSRGIQHHLHAHMQARHRDRSRAELLPCLHSTPQVATQLEQPFPSMPMRALVKGACDRIDR